MTTYSCKSGETSLILSTRCDRLNLYAILYLLLWMILKEAVRFVVVQMGFANSSYIHGKPYAFFDILTFISLLQARNTDYVLFGKALCRVLSRERTFLNLVRL